MTKPTLSVHSAGDGGGGGTMLNDAEASTLDKVDKAGTDVPANGSTSPFLGEETKLPSLETKKKSWKRVRNKLSLSKSFSLGGGRKGQSVDEAAEAPGEKNDKKLESSAVAAEGKEKETKHAKESDEGEGKELEETADDLAATTDNSADPVAMPLTPVVSSPSAKAKPKSILRRGLASGSPKALKAEKAPNNSGRKTNFEVEIEDPEDMIADKLAEKLAFIIEEDGDGKEKNKAEQEHAGKTGTGADDVIAASGAEEVGAERKQTTVVKGGGGKSWAALRSGMNLKSSWSQKRKNRSTAPNFPSLVKEGGGDVGDEKQDADSNKSKVAIIPEVELEKNWEAVQSATEPLCPTIVVLCGLPVGQMFQGQMEALDLSGQKLGQVRARLACCRRYRLFLFSSYFPVFSSKSAFTNTFVRPPPSQRSKHFFCQGA